MSRDIEDIGSIDDISGSELHERGEAVSDDPVATAPEIDPDEDLDELDVEAPEADTADQRIPVVRPEEEPVTGPPPDEVVEADPADAADQRRVVELDEDDYR